MRRTVAGDHVLLPSTEVRPTAQAQEWSAIDRELVGHRKRSVRGCADDPLKDEDSILRVHRDSQKSNGDRASPVSERHQVSSGRQPLMPDDRAGGLIKSDRPRFCIGIAEDFPADLAADERPIRHRVEGHRSVACADT